MSAHPIRSGALEPTRPELRAARPAERVTRLLPVCGLPILTPRQIAGVPIALPQSTTSMLQRFGSEWTSSLAVDDVDSGFTGHPPSAAGDGSDSARQRIRAGEDQSAAGAEPPPLRGWRRVDEADRALPHHPSPGSVAAFHVVTQDDIAFDGSPRTMFDPGNGCRAAYTEIWKGR